MSAAERLGTISHHDAEDAEARLLGHMRHLVEQYATAVRDRDYWEGQARNRAFRNAQAENERLKEQLEITQAALREAVLGFIGYAFPDDEPDDIMEEVLSGFMQSGQLRRIASTPTNSPFDTPDDPMWQPGDPS